MKSTPGTREDGGYPGIFFPNNQDQRNKPKQVLAEMKLFFRKIGRGNPIIILHGLLGASDNWLTIGKQLAESHTVYLLDMRNHGRSPHSEEFNYPVMVTDVNEFMLDHEIRSAVLIGHSMGGKVAMHLALDYPHKFPKLIVVDIAPKIYPLPYFQSIIYALLKADLSGVKLRKEVEKQIAKDIPDRGVRNFLMKNLVRGKKNQFYWKVNLPALYKNAAIMGDEIYRDETYANPPMPIPPCSCGERNRIIFFPKIFRQ
jgi:pimeloyl-ACP methyl ester carboxylesterase